jgi:hypothetical protein
VDYGLVKITFDEAYDPKVLDDMDDVRAMRIKSRLANPAKNMDRYKQLPNLIAGRFEFECRTTHVVLPEKKPTQEGPLQDLQEGIAGLQQGVEACGSNAEALRELAQKFAQKLSQLSQTSSPGNKTKVPPAKSNVKKSKKPTTSSKASQPGSSANPDAEEDADDGRGLPKIGPKCKVKLTVRSVDQVSLPAC